MSVATYKIDEYYVFYSANTFLPRLELKAKGKFVGHLLFKPNGTPLPQDSNTDNYITLWYHLDDFANAIDLLRNEKPIYLWYNGSGPGFENGIRTSEEPIGEGEK